jgi:hypothetical protein
LVEFESDESDMDTSSFGFRAKAHALPGSLLRLKKQSGKLDWVDERWAEEFWGRPRYTTAEQRKRSLTKSFVVGTPDRLIVGPAHQSLEKSHGIKLLS